MTNTKLSTFASSKLMVNRLHFHVRNMQCDPGQGHCHKIENKNINKKEHLTLRIISYWLNITKTKNQFGIIYGSLSISDKATILKSMELFIPLHFTSWKTHFLILAVSAFYQIWLGRLTTLIIPGKMHILLISENLFTHEIKCIGITSFMAFMICMCFLLFW